MTSFATGGSVPGSANKSIHIAVVGSLNVDSVVHVTRFPQPGETLIGKTHALYSGGKGANQAVGAARLLLNTPHAQVSMIGQVGGDEHGVWLRKQLEQTGVDALAVTTDAKVCSGIAIITVDETAQNHIVIVPGANGTFSPQALAAHAECLARAQVVLLQLEIPLETVRAAAETARKNGAVVILDPAPAQTLSSELLALCDFLTPNENELRLLLGQPPSNTPLSRQAAIEGARLLLSQGARNVIVKMGAAGALCVNDREVHNFAPFEVNAVDTTAAGDAWNAGFAVALAQRQNLPEAGRLANAVAALAVSKAGAQPSMPHDNEVQALLRTQAG